MRPQMQKITITKRFFNVHEVAVYLGLSDDTIRAWIKKGKIPFSKFGKAVRFDLQKIEPWLKEREVRYMP